MPVPGTAPQVPTPHTYPSPSPSPRRRPSHEPKPSSNSSANTSLPPPMNTYPTPTMGVRPTSPSRLGVGPPAPLAGRPTCTPSVARPAGRSAHVDVGGPRDARLLRRPLRPRHLAAQLHARLPGTCTTPTPTPMLRPMPRPTLPYLDLSYTLTPHWRRRVMCSLCVPPDRGGAARGEDA